MSSPQKRKTRKEMDETPIYEPRKEIGTREEVWLGLARKTSSRLYRDDLMRNKSGRIVSREASDAARKNRPLKEYLYEEQGFPCPRPPGLPKGKKSKPKPKSKQPSQKKGKSDDDVLPATAFAKGKEDPTRPKSPKPMRNRSKERNESQGTKSQGTKSQGTKSQGTKSQGNKQVQSLAQLLSTLPQTAAPTIRRSERTKEPTKRLGFESKK